MKCSDLGLKQMSLECDLRENMLLGLLGLISGKVIVTFQEAGRMVRTPHSSSHMGHMLACWGLSGSGWVIHGLHKSSRKVRCRQVLLFMH